VKKILTLLFLKKYSLKFERRMAAFAVQETVVTGKSTNTYKYF
jgi:hypothetical protein